MKKIYNEIIPFKGFAAVNVFGILFIRKNFILTDRIINHEEIHTVQMREMLYVPFYIWYSVEWIFKLFKYGLKGAYHNLSFEREAYKNDNDFEYIKRRVMFAWIKLI